MSVGVGKKVVSNICRKQFRMVKLFIPKTHNINIDSRGKMKAILRGDSP